MQSILAGKLLHCLLAEKIASSWEVPKLPVPCSKFLKGFLLMSGTPPETCAAKARFTTSR